MAKRKTIYIDLDIHKNREGRAFAKPVKCITTGFLVYTKIDDYHFFDKDVITQSRKPKYKSKSECYTYLGEWNDVELGSRFVGLIAKNGCFSQAKEEEGMYAAVIPEYSDIYFSDNENDVISSELIIFRTKEALEAYEDEHRVTPISSYWKKLKDKK